jgi:predicted ATPase
MIRLIEALNYRCLRHVSRELHDFQILVGPNAGGKSTVLDVPAFLSRLVSDGLEAAINERARIFEDLVWRRGGSMFELAVELEVITLLSEQIRDRMAGGWYPAARHRVRLSECIGMSPPSQPVEQT